MDLPALAGGDGALAQAREGEVGGRRLRGHQERSGGLAEVGSPHARLNLFDGDHRRAAILWTSSRTTAIRGATATPPVFGRKMSAP